MNLEAILADLQRSQNAASETISKLDTENANLRMQLDDLLARFRRQLDETSRANADTINRLEFEKLTHERLLDDMKKYHTIMQTHYSFNTGDWKMHNKLPKMHLPSWPFWKEILLLGLGE